MNLVCLVFIRITADIPLFHPNERKVIVYWNKEVAVSTFAVWLNFLSVKSCLILAENILRSFKMVLTFFQFYLVRLPLKVNASGRIANVPLNEMKWKLIRYVLIHLIRIVYFFQKRLKKLEFNYEKNLRQICWSFAFILKRKWHDDQGRNSFLFFFSFILFIIFIQPVV